MPRKANDQALTRESILSAAAELIRQAGIEAFSMRKLATALEVNPMAIYYYLPNKEAILQAVIEDSLAAIHLPEAQNWREAIRHVAAAYYQFAKQHPEIFATIATYDRRLPVAFTVDEYLSAALIEAGVTPRKVVQIVYLVVNTVAGMTLSSLKGPLGRTRDFEEVHREFQQLSATDFPNISRLSQQLTPDELQPDFAFALTVLLEGIATQIEN